MERQVTTGYGSLPAQTGGGNLRPPREPRGGRLRRWLPEDRLERASVFSSIALMAGFTVALFLAPGVNGLIGGLTGGGRTGSPRQTLGLTLVAAALAAVGLWLILGPLRMPILGLYPGVGTGEAVLLSVAGLLLGAVTRSLLARVRAAPSRLRA